MQLSMNESNTTNEGIFQILIYKWAFEHTKPLYGRAALFRLFIFPPFKHVDPPDPLISSFKSQDTHQTYSELRIVPITGEI